MPSRVSFALRTAKLTDIERLCAQSGPCISMFLPGQRPGEPDKQHALQCKAMLTAVEKELSRRQVSASDRVSLLASLRDFLGEPDYMNTTLESIALFRSPRAFEVYHVPPTMPPLAAVEARFLVTPLLAKLAPAHNFFVLLVTRKHARLLEVDMLRTHAVPFPEGVPTDLDAFLAFKAPDHRLANRVFAGPDVGSMAGVTFGTGSGKDHQDAYFHDFLKAVDHGLAPVLAAEGKPLVVAGAEAEVAIYRGINSWHQLAHEAVLLSPDGGFTDEQITERARATLRGSLTEEEHRVLAQFEKHGADHRSCLEIQAILRAATEGRVRHLFITEGSRLLGNVDQINGTTRMPGEVMADCDDLINAAAVDTIRHSGQVWILPPDQMPAAVSMAAVFRY